MDCSLCGCTSKTSKKTPRAPRWPLKIVLFEVSRLDMDLCLSFAVKSFSRCAQSQTRGWTQSAAGSGPSRGRAGPRCTAAGEEQRSRRGPSGFPRTPTWVMSALLRTAPGLGNVPVGSVSLLLCSDLGRGAGCAGLRRAQGWRWSSSGRVLLLSGPETPSQDGGLCCGWGSPVWGAVAGRM